MLNYDYLQPDSLAQALDIKKQWGDRAAFMAGGTDVMILSRQGRLTYDALVSLRRVSELMTLEVEDERIVIGSGLTLTELIESDICREELPVLHDAVQVMGSTQMRNQATIGGNVMSAVSSGDTLTPLLALDAVCRLVSTEGERTAPIWEMFPGPRTTAAKPDEILTALEIPRPRCGPGRCSGAFMKLARRVAVDLAVVNAAVQVRLSDDGSEMTYVRAAGGAVGPTPLRLYRTEELMTGSAPNRDVLARAAETAAGEIQPWDDVRSSAWYRARVFGVILRRAAEKAIGRLGLEPGKGDA